MKIYFHKHFKKELIKKSDQERELIKDCLELFLLDPFHSKLRNHPLKGKYNRYRSIDIKYDLRALYKEVSPNEAVFVYLGTHSQLFR